jgi:hypothetical protein
LEVNRKHERLKGEMERLSSALPAVAAAAERAKDALEPSLRRGAHNALASHDYDAQVIKQGSTGSKCVINTILRFIPEGVAEASQIFLRETHVLPKLVSYEEHCRLWW